MDSSTPLPLQATAAKAAVARRAPSRRASRKAPPAASPRWRSASSDIDQAGETIAASQVGG